MKIPVIYTPHAFSFISHPSPVVARTYRLLEWTAKHWTTLLLACSGSEARIAREALGYRPEKVAVWSNALDPSLFHVDDCPPYTFPYVCTISRPSHQKNLTMLVKVMRVLRERGLDTRCVIVGVGFYSPLEKKIRALIHRYRLDDRILMTDWMDHPTSLRILKHCLCYVSTSRYEGLPLSILEAMALERPVVATDVVGNCDCVQPGRTGELVPLGDIGQMADRLQRLIGDAALRQRMGAMARQLFLDRFDVTKTIGKLEQIYQSLADGHRP
jgi:glycosyltransferase involved in cell wall biosynthesis